MQQSYFSFVFDAITQLLTQQSSLFESMGMNLFRAFALIMISWFGVQSALSQREFHWPRFSALLQEILICYTMLAFYSLPIPGIGISFTHLVLDQVQNMIASLNQTSVQGILESLNGLETNLPYPSPLEILQIIRFMILDFAIIGAEAVTLVITMFGYVATGVIVLLGPLFIPFKIVPQMEWMFWGWFRAFLQFAFYQLIASAYVFVFGQFLMQILGAKSGPLSSSNIGYLFVPLLLTLVTFILGTLKVPALTFSIFSGRAGEYVLPRWR